MVKGRIHSFESMGLVDGPGIRTIVFFQGCKLRCAYCHNPDTWGMTQGEEVMPQDLIKKINRFKTYFSKSGGGVTFSGGDPLMQPEFLIEMLKLCRENGIHTAIDTSGYGMGTKEQYEEILKLVDMVLFDIKHVEAEGHKKLTGFERKDSEDFMELLRNSDAKIWVRHVIVPGITDSKENIIELSKIIKTLKNVEKIELLPYHLLGIAKYEKMGIPYRLEGVEAMDRDKVHELENILKEQLGK